MSLHGFMKEIAHNSILLLKSDRSYRGGGGRQGWVQKASGLGGGRAG